MKRFHLPTSWLLAFSVLGGCGKKETPPVPAAEAAPAAQERRRPGWEHLGPPLVTPPPVPTPKPQTMTIVDKIPFGSAHSTAEELEAFLKEVKQPNLREGSRHLRTMTAKRTPEGMKAMIALLREYEAKLPHAPPSKEELLSAAKALDADITALGQDHFFVCFGMAQAVAVELIHFDVPEAREAAEGYRSRIRQKWQGGEVDAYLKVLDSEFKNAYGTVKDGGAPWQERKFSD